MALIRRIAVYVVVFGFVFYGIDLREAFASKLAVARATTFIQRDHPDATVWYTGHWGFQYYAEQAGMKPVVTGQSQLTTGDWLVVPDPRYEQQRVRTGIPELKAETEIRVVDWLPLRTVMGYYSGSAPLEHHDGPRIAVTIYRVLENFIPSAPWVTP